MSVSYDDDASAVVMKNFFVILVFVAASYPQKMHHAKIPTITVSVL